MLVNLLNWAVQIFSSLEPKAQVSFSDQNLSVVRRRCRCRRCRRRRCRKLFTFSSSSPEPLSQISTNLGTKHPLVKGIQVSSNEVSRPIPRGDNYEIAKIHWWNLKKTSSQEPLGQFQPNLAQCTWVKGIQVCSKEGPRPIPRGDGNKIAKIHWRN